MSEEGDYSLPLLYSEWKCPFATGRQVNSGFGKMSPARMSFSVQNEPEVLLGLLSPLDRQSWSCPLAKSTGLHFLLLQTRAAPGTLWATAPCPAESWVWVSVLLFVCEGPTEDVGPKQVPLGQFVLQNQGWMAGNRGTVPALMLLCISCLSQEKGPSTKHQGPFIRRENSQFGVCSFAAK